MPKQPAQLLYSQIKTDIQENRLPVGQALKQEMLSQRYNVSRIPVRDVLHRLKSEGWLIPCGKRGVMIPQLNATEAEDLYLMRMYLEPLILAQSIPNLNQQMLGKAADILTKLDNNKDLSIEENGELNWQFHACLYEPANRPTLFGTIASLHQQCGRYIGYHSQKLQYSNTSQDEHYQILNAISEKNISHAQAILKAHIRDAGEILVNYLNDLE
ncbi:GntR family transcriptional regulator [Aliiglaciecola lipolytica]|uniref:GntR family transcriptional regulator n=1 Tax=Aliiglaciecola lipolytica E3 TaxID=1127673 RepID=K6X125_9ALTE|nr:GntR family transcriptional regulator [Aliiglaciecola lipolytica]GAC14339.1 GntR family transcriptional regulator [Aliiglaciecola lipolytica E3]